MHAGFGHQVDVLGLFFQRPKHIGPLGQHTWALFQGIFCNFLYSLFQCIINLREKKYQTQFRSWHESKFWQVKTKHSSLLLFNAFSPYLFFFKLQFNIFFVIIVFLFNLKKCNLIIFQLPSMHFHYHLSSFMFLRLSTIINGEKLCPLSLMLY